VRRPDRLSTSGYWLAAVIAVLGLVAGVLWGTAEAFSTIKSTDAFTRGSIPGTFAVQVTDTGRKVVYYEGDSAPSLQRLDLFVTGPDGLQVGLTEYWFTLQYDVPGRPGVTATAMARFRADKPGTYLLTSAFEPTSPAQLAVGDDLGQTFVLSLAGPVILGFGALNVALIIAVITFIRRRSGQHVGRS
jgi:hypothetical protein